MAYFADNPNCPSNFLSGIGFQFSLKKLPGVSFYCQSANVPSMNLSVATQATRWNTLPEPGDEVNYDDLTVRFLVDEDLKNYMSIHNWIRYLGHPESSKDWAEFSDGESYTERQYSDGVIFILDSNFNKKFEIYFKDLFPVSLGGLNFDSTYTDTEYFAVDATFKFSIFEINEIGKPAFDNYPKPTVTLTSELTQNKNGIPIVRLSYSSTNSQHLTIDQGVGVVEIERGVYEILQSSILASSVTYTITATGSGGEATASTTVSLPTKVVAISVVDENTKVSKSDMETKWNQFRTNWPDREFYLLQPLTCTSTEVLRTPVSFLEETDPTTITNVCPPSTIIFTEDNKYGSYLSTSQRGIETPAFNNTTPDTLDNIARYGVFRIGLEQGCGDLSDIITLLQNNATLTTVLNYINGGGVLWINGEWVRGGCSNQSNMNTILTLLGSSIRQDGDLATSGNMTRSNIQEVIDAGFPSVLFHNATGKFTGGSPIYQYTNGSTTYDTFVYERIGNGLVVVSADVNTYQSSVYTLLPPQELYTAFRALV